MYVSGSQSKTPLKIFGEQSNYNASLFAAIGILIALRKCARDGSGAHLDISLQESMASTLEHVLVRYFIEGIIPCRQGSEHWNHTFFILPCKDGFIHLTLFDSWETLLELLESENMAADLKEEKWKNDEFRNENIDHVLDVLKRWTKQHTTQELFELGQSMRFPWAPVQSPIHLANNPQLRARNFFVPIQHPINGAAIMTPGIPFKFQSSFEMPKKSAPEPGQDNREIYHKELKISDKELKRLYSLKII
jgi:crotonobetainyl-CoA:carnitine CoA-transferase CaiB-like acyl-CoA transferase